MVASTGALLHTDRVKHGYRSQCSSTYRHGQEWLPEPVLCYTQTGSRMVAVTSARVHTDRVRNSCRNRCFATHRPGQEWLPEPVLEYTQTGSGTVLVDGAKLQSVPLSYCYATIITSNSRQLSTLLTEFQSTFSRLWGVEPRTEP
jgi:hypothetical protein